MMLSIGTQECKNLADIANIQLVIPNSKTQYTKDVCSECEPKYFLNPLTMKCEACAAETSTHCVQCIDTSTTCLKCSDGYALSSSGCTACSDPNCLSCSATQLGLCKVCKAGFLVKFGSPSGCTDQPVSGQGKDGTAPILAPCSTSECDDCHDDFKVCKRCKTTFFLLNNKCVGKTAIPTGFGPDTVAGSLVPCPSNCQDCKNDAKVCLSCNSGFYMKNTTCVNQLADGEGLNLETSLIEPCVVYACSDCRENVLVCKACNQSLGVSLHENACIQTKLNSNLRETVPTSVSTDKALKPISILFSTTPDVSFEILAAHAETVTPVLKFDQVSPLSFSRDVVQLAPNMARLDFVPQSIPDQKLSRFTLKVAGGEVKEKKTGITYEFLAASLEGNYTSSLTSGEFSQILQQAQAAEAIGAVGNIQSGTGTVAYGALIAMDPTGIIFRFTRVIQVISKLYYINVFFGSKLEPVLKAAAYSVKEDKNTLVRTSRSVAGRLFAMQVPITVAHSSVYVKIWLYWVVWAIKIVKMFILRHTDLATHKWTVYFVYWSQRAELVALNLVFTDFAWIAPRTLLQSQKLSKSVLYTAYVTLCLLLADFLGIVSFLSKRWVWQKYRSLAIPDFESAKESAKPDDAPDDMKQINYKKTYFEIEYNHHLMRVVGAVVAPNTTLDGSSWACILICLSPWYRIVLLQLVIISCQTSIKFGLIVLAACEATRIFTTIYCHYAYNYLSNIWYLLSDVSQSLFLGTFACFCLFLSGHFSDEQVPESYQTFGLWLLIAGTALEYLLLVLQLGHKTYAFLKQRKQMAALGVRVKPWTMFYYYTPETNTTSNLASNLDNVSSSEQLAPKQEFNFEIPDIFLPVNEMERKKFESARRAMFNPRRSMRSIVTQLPPLKKIFPDPKGKNF